MGLRTALNRNCELTVRGVWGANKEMAYLAQQGFMFAASTVERVTRTRCHTNGRHATKSMDPCGEQ